MKRKKGAGKNEVWQSIFDQDGSKIESSIDRNGYYDITADELKAYSNPLHGPDTRNLAKFDKSFDLPDAFKAGTDNMDQFINIMPLGYIEGAYTYRLGRFNAYEQLTIDENQKPELINFPSVQTITPESIPSENAYIDAAFSSGMLNMAFESQNKPLMPVLHGRMGSGPMSFQIGKQQPQTLDVHSAQIEIDATFENDDSIVVIEAKAVPEKDFLVRQLFYPYYVIRKRGVTKPVRPTFLSLLGGNYYFNEYMFEEPNNYSTIKMVRQRVFRFYDTTPITLDRVMKSYKETKVIEEPEVSFPQANSYTVFVKALNVLNAAFDDDDNVNNGLKRGEILASLAYDSRQGAYYGDLIRYLGLCEIQDHFLVINQRGRDLLRALDSNEGRLQLIELLLEHAPLRYLFMYLIDHPEKITHPMSRAEKEEVGQAISPMIASKVSGSTLPRRVSGNISFLKSVIFDAISDDIK